MNLIILSIFILSNFLFGAKPVSKLCRPILNIPELVIPGSEFEILFKPSGVPTRFAGRITSTLGISIPLSIVRWYQSGEYYIVRAVVPYGTPYDLYRLVIATDTEQDSSLNALRVIPQFLDNFYFVHITDTHIPSQLDPEYPVRYLDQNTLEEFNEILYELQFINPEFVIHTGDLIDNYIIESQYQIAQDALSTSKIPIFVTAGNHDLNDFWIPFVEPGRVKWERYYGKIMNYTFRYGRIFFIGLEAYNTPSISFTEDQLNFLSSELLSSYTRGDLLRTVFYHADIRRTDLGIPQITDDLVDNYHIDMTLWGHTHIDGVYSLGTRGIPDINTTTTTSDVGRFRLIKIAGSSIVSYNALSWNHLSVSFYPLNDGRSRRVVATINNFHSERFENGFVRFFLDGSSTNPTVIGGRTLQVLNLDSILVVDVNVDILPNSTTTVEVLGEPLSIFHQGNKVLQAVAGSETYFNPELVRYNIPEGLSGTIQLFNVIGEKILEQVCSKSGEINIRNLGVGSGVYFVYARVGSVEERLKITIIK